MTDLDQGGVDRRFVKQYLGPTVGWIDAPFNNTKHITVGGAYTLDVGVTQVLLDVAAEVTLQLWNPIPPTVPPPNSLPGPSIDMPLSIIDIGGNTGSFPCTILPAAGKEINGDTELLIAEAYGTALLEPDAEYGNWNSLGGGGSAGTTGAPMYASAAAVTAASIASDIEQIQTASYYANNKAGGALYFRVASEPTHGGKLSSNGGTVWWEVDTSKGVFPMQWGAYGDGDAVSPHDDTAALNLCLAYIFAEQATALQARKYFIDGQSRIYYHTGSLNGTLIRARHNWGIRNLALHSACTGKAALDLVGSRYGYFQNLYSFGSQTNQPSCFIQVARADILGSFPAAGTHTFLRCGSAGYFEDQVHMNYGSEENLYLHCTFINERDTDGSGEAWSAVFQGDDVKPVSSDFTTVATGPQAFNSNEMLKCLWIKTGNGDAVYVSGCLGFEFRRNYWVANAGYSTVVADLDDTIRDLVLDGHFEGTPDELVKFIGTGSKTIYGLYIRDQSPHCTQQVFGISGLTDATLNSVKGEFKDWNAGSLANGLFEDNTKFTVADADFYIATQFEYRDVFDFISFTGRAAAVDYPVGRLFTLEVEGDTPFTAIWRDDGATALQLNYNRFSGSAAASDQLTWLNFKGSSAAGPQVTYVRLETSIEASVAGAEYGQYIWKVVVNGVLTEVMKYSATGRLMTVAGGIRSNTATGGIGYAAGAGGAVVQATSKSTAVTLDTVTGAVTMNAAALAANTTVIFQLNSTAIASTDLLVVNHRSGGTFGNYQVWAQVNGTGVANIAVRNITAGSLSDAVQIRFAVVKAAIT